MGGRSQYSRGRMVISFDLPREIEWPIVSGKKLVRPPRTLFARVIQTPHIDDIPWVYPLVVSRKVRDIMMDIDGRYLKAYPVRLSRSVGVQYYVLHCLRLVYCNVPPKALNRTDWGLDSLVIDPSRVPDNTHVFHARTLETRLNVSDVMRNAILQAGCTGGAFYPAQQWPLPPNWRPMSAWLDPSPRKSRRPR